MGKENLGADARGHVCIFYKTSVMQPRRHSKNRFCCCASDRSENYPSTLCNYFISDKKKKKLPLRLWVALSTQICDVERIKAHCKEHLFATDYIHGSHSHGSTLVRNYLLWLSPDKILRGLTPLSFGFDLQGPLTEAFGGGGWSLPLYTPPALDLPLFTTDNKHMDPQCQLGSPLSGKCTAVRWQMIAGWSTWRLRHACQRRCNKTGIWDHLK